MKVQQHPPSAGVRADVQDHEGEPGVDDAPDGEGPASWSDVCLVAGRHISYGGMEGTWRAEVSHQVGQGGGCWQLCSPSHRCCEENWKTTNSPVPAAENQVWLQHLWLAADPQDALD